MQTVMAPRTGGPFQGDLLADTSPPLLALLKEKERTRMQVRLEVLDQGPDTSFCELDLSFLMCNKTKLS
jgi:hypothetical protein